jgi:hypothetical protein
MLYAALIIKKKSWYEGIKGYHIMIIIAHFILVYHLNQLK